MWQQSRENSKQIRPKAAKPVLCSEVQATYHGTLLPLLQVCHHKKKPKVDVQWVLNKHPEATGEPSKKQELCFLADVLFRKPRATMALGYWKIHY